MNRSSYLSITFRYRSVLLVLLSAIIITVNCYINSVVSMSVHNTKSNMNIRKKKDLQHRHIFANENEKYLYGNYLVTLRKCKRIINYSKLFNSTVDSRHSRDSRDSRDSTENIYCNIKNNTNTIINNDQFIAKRIILANIKIDVSAVKYIQISTKNDTITIELDKNNDNVKNTDKGFINYDLSKIDSLISAISILMNLLNIH